MIEAELKALLRHPSAVRGALATRASVEYATYQDTYYDDAAGLLRAGGRELRLRTKTIESYARHILTYKASPVDAASDSKPEHESVVADRGAVEQVLAGLGYRPWITLTKRCENYAFEYDGRQVLATVVTVPEIDGTYLEVETMVAAHDVGAALASLRELLHTLGVTDAELTTQTYTGAVQAAWESGGD